MGDIKKAKNTKQDDADKVVGMIGDLPPEKREIVAQRMSVSYQGPLPPASQMEKYEKIVPGMGKRILKMAEDDAKHMRSFENACLKKEHFFNMVGLFLGFSLSIGALLAAIYFAYRGDFYIASGFFGYPLSQVFLKYIFNRNKEE